jgi:uncharacterized protein YdeI (YjbR/CyaY-like superfamily)
MGRSPGACTRTRRGARSRIRCRQCASSHIRGGRPRDTETPADLARALREAMLLAAFERAAPGKRQHIVEWVDEVRSDAARERRIAKVVERILAEEEKRSDRAAKKRER